MTVLHPLIVCLRYAARQYRKVFVRTVNENWVLVLAAGLLFTNLNDRDLWASHEARAAQNAQLFLDNNDWGVLHLFDGSPDYQKPPLFYWLVAGIAWIRGGTVDAFAVRLPAALAAWLTVFMVMRFFRRHGRPTAAAIAGLTLITAQHFLAISRTGRIDVALTAAVTVAIFALVENRWLIAGLAMGADLLLKGPIGLVLPIVVSWAARSANKGEDRCPCWRCGLLAVVVALCVAGPWFVFVGWQTNWEFWRVFFWYHNVQRAAGTADELAHHPFWYYLVRWLVDWLPWSPALFAAGIVAIRRRFWHSDGQLRLGILWLGAVTMLLSCSQFKRADYLIVAYPGAAIILGCIGESCFLRHDAQKRILARHFCQVTLIATIVGYVVFELMTVPQLNARFQQRYFADMIRRQAPTNQMVIFFRVEDHLLAWHVKPPLVTVKEWENLAIWIERLGNVTVIMPDAEADTWSDHLFHAKLHEVSRFNDASGRDRPRTWVLMQCRYE